MPRGKNSIFYTFAGSWPWCFATGIRGYEAGRELADDRKILPSNGCRDRRLLVTGAAWFVLVALAEPAAHGRKLAFGFCFRVRNNAQILGFLISTWRARSPTETAGEFRRRYSSSPASKGRASLGRDQLPLPPRSRVHRDTCSARGIAFRRVPLRRTRSRGRWPCLRKGELFCRSIRSTDSGTALVRRFSRICSLLIGCPASPYCT